MDEKKKQKVAYIWAILTVIVTCMVGYSAAHFSDQFLPLLLGASALFFGPVTGVLYLRELKKGVFKVDEDER